MVQETYFTDTFTIPIGKWLLISSGVLTNLENNTTIPTAKIKTGVAIYLNPKAKCAVTNYIKVSDRIMSATLLTKCGTLAIINHHAPDNTKHITTKKLCLNHFLCDRILPSGRQSKMQILKLINYS